MLKILKEMKKIILALAILFTSGIFTSCTDINEDIVPNQAQELQSTGGNEQDPDPDPDEDPNGKG